MLVICQLFMAGSTVTPARVNCCPTAPDATNTGAAGTFSVDTVAPEESLPVNVTVTLAPLPLLSMNNANCGLPVGFTTRSRAERVPLVSAWVTGEKASCWLLTELFSLPARLEILANPFMKD